MIEQLDSPLGEGHVLEDIKSREAIAMLKIGDFSKLARVSVKTLRLYDRLGLLEPARIDQFTGYRYYLAEQMPKLNRILAFKDLGFSLSFRSEVLITVYCLLITEMTEIQFPVEKV